MQDRRRLIELIQSLSKQESARQPTPEQWLHEQDEKARNGAAPVASGTSPSHPGSGTAPDTAADDPMQADDFPDRPVA